MACRGGRQGAATGMNERSIALDWMRGLAVAGMIVVVSPGAWEHVHPWLQHAAWHGWTPADLVFPAFLFCVGVALGLPFLREEPVRLTRAFWLKALRRAGLLILIGLVLNGLPDLDLDRLRLPGILQRIAICYLLALGVCALALRAGRLRVALVVGAALFLLAAYWVVLAFVPTPGFGAGRLDSLGAFPTWLDRAVLTPDHMWRQGITPGFGVTYDPEGLLSSLPGTVNVLIGVLAAHLIAGRGRGTARGAVIAASVLLVSAGLALSPVMPVNKALWTPTFAVLTAGLSLAVFILLDWARADPRASVLGAPFRMMGANAMLAFILSQLMGIYGSMPILADGRSIQAWGYEVVRTGIADPVLASFVCALAVLGLILVVLYPLDKMGWRLKL